MIGARHERSHRSHAARRAPNVRGERISVAKAIGGPRGMERIPDGIGAASMGGAKWQGGRRWSMIGGGGSIMDPGGLPGRSAASARSAPCLKEASGRVTSPRAVLALPRARGCASFRRKSTKNPFKGLYSIKERSGGVFSAKKWGFSSRRRRLSGHRRSCPWCDRSGARRRAGGGVPGRSVDSAPAQPGLRASDRSTLGPRPATADRPRCRDHGLGPPTGARLGAGSMRRSRVVRDL